MKKIMALFITMLFLIVSFAIPATTVQANTQSFEEEITELDANRARYQITCPSGGKHIM